MILEKPATIIEKLAAIRTDIGSTLDIMVKWHYHSMPCVFECNSTKSGLSSVPIMFGSKIKNGERIHFVMAPNAESGEYRSQEFQHLNNIVEWLDDAGCYHENTQVLERTETWDKVKKELVPIILNNHAVKAGMNEDIIDFLKNWKQGELTAYLESISDTGKSTAHILNEYLVNEMGGAASFAISNGRKSQETTVTRSMMTWLEKEYLPICQNGRLHTVTFWHDKDGKLIYLDDAVSWHEAENGTSQLT